MDAKASFIMEALDHGWTVTKDQRNDCYLFTKDNHAMTPEELAHIKEHGFSQKFLKKMSKATGGKINKK